MEDDDPHWRDPEVLDAYTRFCESYEDVEALIRTLRILHKDTRDYDRQRRLILDEDVRVLESVEGLDDAADSMDTLRMDLLNDLHKATRPHRYTVMRPRRRVI
ncbi:hypothetical protein [Bifidobacterium saguini]|uniref:hypothetical protein n=1 Tax=Bifidobacterium saguini TaxID=762210 RepID=UPI000ADC72F2|nr:hypothetical protein [Bifidobacterium saguini]